MSKLLKVMPNIIVVILMIMMITLNFDLICQSISDSNSHAGRIIGTVRYDIWEFFYNLTTKKEAPTEAEY